MSDEVRKAVESLILKSCEQAELLLEQQTESAVEIIRSVANLLSIAK